MPARPTAAGRRPRRFPPLRFAARHPLSVLLALEAFAIFALAPSIQIGVAPAASLPATFALILLAGMYALRDRAWPGRVVVALGLVLLPVELWRYARGDEAPVTLHLAGLIGFFLAVTALLARAVFGSRRIKMDQVLGGVCLYLNIGLTFAAIYALLDHLAPASFLLPSPEPGRPVHPVYFIYFSLVTLTTVGYGDTLPVSAAARAMATLEAALGQLYPAIVLARLVSTELTQRDRTAQERRSPPRDLPG